MREHGSRIYTLAYRLTGNQADAEDLAQETFLKAYRHRNRYQGRAAAATWLYRICVNSWKNRVRHEKRRFFWKHFSLDRNHKGEENPVELDSGEKPLDLTMAQAERNIRVNQALGRLDPEERAIIILRDMRDEPYEAISEALAIPLGTVKSRLARSREKLRGLLGPILRDNA